MGGIISRPVNFVKRKVTETKNAAVNKVVGAKDHVFRKLGNACDAVYTRINRTGVAIVTKVTNARDTVYDGVIGTKNSIVNRVVAVKEAGVTRFNNTVARARRVRDNVVTTYRNTKETVYNRYTSVKTGITDRYTNTKNSIKERYLYLRHRKYSRWEKVKYSCLFVLLLYAALVALLCLHDVYKGQPELAQERLEKIWVGFCGFLSKIWNLTCILLEHAWNVVCIVTEYTLYGIKVTAEYTWHYSQVLAHYIWIGVKIAAHYSYTYSKLGVEYLCMGIKVASIYTWEGMKICAFYIFTTLQVICHYLLTGTKVVGQHSMAAAKIGAIYTYEGGKLTAEYASGGFKYSLKHGSVALKNLAIKTVQWTWYFLTNFRAASYDSSVYLWDTTKWLTVNLWFGSKEGSYIAWQGTKYIVNATYHGSINAGRLSIVALKTSYEYTCWGGKQTYDTALYSTNITYHGIKYGITTTIWIANTTVHEVSNAVVYITKTSYSAARSFSYNAYDTSKTVAYFLYTWTCKITVKTGKLLHMGLNEYLLRWLFSTVGFLFEWIVIIAEILWTFLRDLNFMLLNVIMVVARQIYKVLYIVFAFIYHIVAGVTYIIKGLVKGMVYCVTSVFSVIIWALEETVFAYTYVLHKYNMYREILFFGSITIIVMYCSGLMRDHVQSRADGDESTTDSEDELDTNLGVEEIEPLQYSKGAVAGDSDEKTPDSPRTVRFEEWTSSATTTAITTAMRKKRTVAPPKYIERSPIPAYTDEILSEDSDEFTLDYDDVPDFRHLSDSDPEPEPPSPDNILDHDGHPNLNPSSSSSSSENGDDFSEPPTPSEENGGEHRPSDNKNTLIKGAQTDTSTSHREGSLLQSNVKSFAEGDHDSGKGHEADFEDSDCSDAEVCNFVESVNKTS